MTSARADLRDELDHCKKMVTQTHAAIESRILELSNVDVPIEGERELVDALERQHQLWRQLANEIETYLATSAPTEQEVLFS